MLPPSVAIIILNWNGLQDTLECLESVFKNTYPNYSVYVVDNASEKDELKKIATLIRRSVLSSRSKDEFLANDANRNAITFIQNKENLGFSEGNNVGIRKAIADGAEYIFTLNNDTVVDPNFLTEAIKIIDCHPDRPAESRERRDLSAVQKQDSSASSRQGGTPLGMTKKVAIVATTMLNYHDHTKIDSLGHDLLTSGDTIPRGRGEVLRSLQPNFGACAGAALYSVEMLRHIDLFDPDFFLNYEDSDLSLRALVNGWRIVHCPTSIVYHKGQTSIKKIKEPSPSSFLPPPSSFLSPTAYRIRSQRNMLWAYFHNIPLPVILLNLPWLILRDILGVFLSALLFRWNVTKILICSRWQVLKSLPMIIRKRRKNLKHQKISSWWIWKNQKSWIPVYVGYLWNIIFSVIPTKPEGRVEESLVSREPSDSSTLSVRSE